eukprot:COSAG05_NODE_9771_length_602_cov_0.920477_1_plen_75_part_00
MYSLACIEKAHKLLVGLGPIGSYHPTAVIVRLATGTCRSTVSVVYIRVLAIYSKISYSYTVPTTTTTAVVGRIY